MEVNLLWNIYVLKLLLQSDSNFFKHLLFDQKQQIVSA